MSNESDQLEELIKEIAYKHGVAVDRDDPLLILQTLHQRLIDDMSKAQEKSLAKFHSEIEQISKTWSEDTKNKADKLINEVLNASKSTVKDCFEDAAQSVISTLKTEINGSFKRINTASKEAKTTATMSIVASSMAILASALAIFLQL